MADFGAGAGTREIIKTRRAGARDFVWKETALYSNIESAGGIESDIAQDREKTEKTFELAKRNFIPAS